MIDLMGSIHWQTPAKPLPLPQLDSCRQAQVYCWQSDDGHCWLGAQPITSHCGRFTMVFTGKIFNHHAVRNGLRFQDWRSEDDRETLVEGLAQRGLALVHELRGMFAFAAYDRDKQQLLIGRDPIGIQPFFFWWFDGGMRFSSERYALCSAQGLSEQEISQVLAFGHLPSPADFPGPNSDGIHSLPAGMVVRINRKRPHDPVRYWPPQPRPDWSPLPIRTRGRAQQLLRDQLEDAVKLQIMTDTPVACFLSSTIESCIITAIACRVRGDRIKSVTVLLPGASLDYREGAREMARHCGTDHHEIRLDDDKALSWIAASLQELDVPSVASLKAYLVTRAVAEQGFKVAISGLGADELFGGYPSHQIVPWLLSLRGLPQGPRQRLLQMFVGPVANRLQQLPSWDCWHLTLALVRWASGSDMAAAGAERLSWPAPPPQRITQVWGQISWAELFGTTEPMMLRYRSCMSAASKLELRMPFLDHRIVETGLRMPQRFQRRSKGLLRDAFADLLPLSHLSYTNRSLSLPMRNWMMVPLQGLCLDRLKALQAIGWLEPSWITRQWQAFECGQLHWTRAWNLVVLGEWAMRMQQP